MQLINKVRTGSERDKISLAGNVTTLNNLRAACFLVALGKYLLKLHL